MACVLVTGITGQDGGYLADLVCRDGHEVHGFARADDARADKLRERFPRVALHGGDIADSKRVHGLIDDIEPDEIYNLASISSVARSWQEPLLTAQVCGMGAASVLEAAWRMRQRTGRNVRCLQASSAEIFGEPASAPQDESTPVQPRSPYGAAKAFAHHLVSVYRKRGLHAVSLILYNHESPRRPLDFVTRKISRGVAEIALGRRSELILGNLDVRRDWGWAPDYVDAMVRALRYPVADDYVIATGRDRSVRDFVDVAFARVGITTWQPLVRTDAALTRPTDPPLLVGDARKARDRLHWSFTASFEETVARMVDADLDELRRDR